LPGVEGRDEGFRGEAKMHEVAETSAVAFAVFILSTTGFTEVCDGRELSIQRATSIPPLVQLLDGLLSFGLPLVSSIHVADEMVANVVADMQFEEMTVLGELAIEVFVHGVKVLLQVVVREFVIGVVRRIVVDVG